MEHDNLSVVFCDKRSQEGPGSIINNQEMPVEFLNDTPITLRDRLFWKGFVSGDITEESTGSNILSMSRKTGTLTNFLLSDIVPDDLRISDQDYRLLIYHILRTATMIVSDGGFILFRLVLLDQVDWYSIIKIILTSFSHIHMFISFFDRPELTSVYFMIINSRSDEHYAPDFYQRITKINCSLGLDTWDKTMLDSQLTILLQTKTHQLFTYELSEFKPYQKDYTYLLISHHICPIRSIFIDWSNGVFPVGDHWCDSFKSLHSIYMSNKNIMDRFMRNCNLLDPQEETLMTKYATEYLTCCFFSDIWDEINRGLMLRNHDIIRILDNCIVSQLPRISQIIYSQVENHYILSPHYRNIKLRIHLWKHLLRILSWYAMQFFVREQGYDTDHPWFSRSLHDQLCYKCVKLIKSIPCSRSWETYQSYSMTCIIE